MYLVVFNSGLFIVKIVNAGVGILVLHKIGGMVCLAILTVEINQDWSKLKPVTHSLSETGRREAHKANKTIWARAEGDVVQQRKNDGIRLSNRFHSCYALKQGELL